MTPDLALVLGLLFVLLAIPNLVGAFSRGEPPRLAAILGITGGGLLVWANLQKPGGYSSEEIPQTIMSVLSGLFT